MMLLALLVGCGGQTDGGGLDAATDAGHDASEAEASCTLSASSYSTTCSVDSDCIAVFVGDACSHCFCPNATIAASDKVRYEADFAATGHGGQVCFCPPDPIPLCCHGTCTIAGCDGGP